mgnify:CR=1 FL=1
MSLPLRVLIVEDNPDDAELMLLQLRAEGFELTWQVVATEAAYLAALDEKPDLILADWSLPQFSGLRALRLRNERGLDIPFIIVSGGIGEEAAVDALRQGAHDYIFKDRPIRLGQAAQHALEDRRLRQEREQAGRVIRLQAAALEAAANAIVITDRNGTIQWVNPAWSALTGYTRAEAIGQNPRILKSVYQDQTFYERLWATILAGRVWRGELVNRRKDGTLYIEEQTITPLIDASGQVTHFIGIKQDISERKRQETELQQLLAEAEQARRALLSVIEDQKRAEEALQALNRALSETNDRLQEALRAKEEMIQNVSHELRTPLTLILGHVDLLGAGYLGPLSPEQRHSIAVMEKQGRRLLFLVNRLLLLQTLSAHTVRKTSFDVVSWLTQVASSWEQRAAEAGIEMHLDLPLDLPHAAADPDLLEQVITNLLDNAFKFSPSGGRVTLAACQNGSCLHIRVQDQGVGIPAEKLERVFERFYQVDGSSTRRFGGMGIGLALCRAIVQAHGGEIWAESAGPGQGSAFIVSLPLE